ncbi:MAG: hypothetical protein RMH75_06685 [Archaeoglobaceae archaeon]|nr:hypothetical protein [Archaeoglobaceae archaeon]
MIVLWKLMRLSELLNALEINPRERTSYVHSAVFLAQDFKCMEICYNDYVLEGYLYSHDLEKDLEILRLVNFDTFPKSFLDLNRVSELKKFIKDKRMTVLLAQEVYTRRRKNGKKSKSREIKKLFKDYLEAKSRNSKKFSQIAPNPKAGVIA